MIVNILEKILYKKRINSPQKPVEVTDDSSAGLNGEAKEVVDFEPDAGIIVKDKVLIKYEGVASIVRIPTNVKAIGRGAFSENKNVLEVVIPDTVVEICDYAFYHCINLSQVRMGNQVQKIGWGAFFDCQNLKWVEFSQSLISIDDMAFSRCNNLVKIDILSPLERIGESAFRGCSKLSKVVLPDSVTEMGTYVFYGCDLDEIKAPSWIIEVVSKEQESKF